jgi:CRP-like cAMP-binding protein
MSAQTSRFPHWWPPAVAAGESVKTPSLWETLKSDLDIQKYLPMQRAGIVSKEMTDASGRHYMLKNGLTRSYVRLSTEEFWVWERIDGETTVQQLVFAFFQEYKAFAFGAIASLIDRLRASNMLSDPPQALYRDLSEALKERSLVYKLSWLAQTFLTREFAIKGLDGYLNDIYRYGGWLFFTVPVRILFFLICLVGTYFFIELVKDPRYHLLQPGSVIQLGLLSYIPLVIHEFGHAITAKHEGCDVYKGGVMLYYGLPAAFVDTTDVWMFGKRARIAVTWAGPYTGYIIAGICSLVVRLVPGLSPNTSVLLLQIALVAVTISTFNVLPLVKLDGYYLLSDALEIPRLHERSMEFLTQRLFTNIREHKKWTREEKIFLAFGILAFVSTFYFSWSGLLFWDRQAGQSISQLLDLQGNLFLNIGVALLAVSGLVYSFLLLSNGVKQAITTLRKKGLLSRPDKTALVIVLAVTAFVFTLHIALPTIAPWIMAVGGFGAFAFAAWMALNNFRFMSGSVYRWMWLAAVLASLVGMGSFVIEWKQGLSALRSSLLWAGTILMILFFLLAGHLPRGLIGSWRGHSLWLVALGTVVYGSLFSNSDVRTISAGLIFGGLVHWSMRPRSQFETHKYEPASSTREKIAAAFVWIQSLILPELELDFGKSTRVHVERGIRGVRNDITAIVDSSFGPVDMTAGESGRRMAVELEDLLVKVERVGGAPYARRLLAFGYDTLDWELQEIAEDYLLKYIPHALGLSRELSTRRDELVALLRSNPLFMSLDEARLGKLSRHFRLRRYDRNATIIRAGETGTTFYVIHTGRVDVFSQQGEFLHPLGRGDYFGEAALLTNKKRNATILASTPVDVLVLSKPQFDKFLRTNVDFDDKARAEFHRLGMLRQLPIFEQLNGNQLRMIAKQLEQIEVMKEEVICRQGEIGDSFYMIDRGEVKVEIDSIKRATLEAGDYFGEIGLIMDCPRVATVTACQPTILFRLKASDFQELLQSSTSLKEGIERTSSRRVLLNQRWSRSYIDPNGNLQTR